jgi:hypothetical protein
MGDRTPAGRVSRRVRLPWSEARWWCGVLVEDVADGDGFVAVWAESAEVDSLAGLVAVVAVLLGEVAGVAPGALIDGDVTSAGGGGHDDGRSRLGVAGTPGGLAAGGCAVALPADRGECVRADWAGRRFDVVTHVVT